MSAHLQAQALRFARLFVVAFAAQLVTLGTDHLGLQAVAAAALGAVEVVIRQFYPVAPATPPATPPPGT